MLNDRDACVRFSLGNAGYGLPLAEIREITPILRIFPVPLAPRSIRGVCSHRGRVVTLLDAGALMGRDLPAARRDDDKLAILLAPPHGHLAVYVHGPVEMDRIDPRQQVARATQRAAGGSDVRSDDSFSPIPMAMRAAEEGILTLLSCADLIFRCEAEIRGGFRRQR